MIQLKKKSILLVALLIIFSVNLPASGWKIVKDNSGIQLYVRPVPDSKVNEYMAVTILESSLSSPVSVLEDTPNYTQWNYKCIEAKLLHRKNDYERITYMATESPWPVENRDIAVKSVLTQDKKTGIVTIELKGLPDYTPGRDGRVRMASLKGYWIFESLGNGKVKAIYRLHSEPGGSVPESLVNGTGRDIVYNTVWNMRNMVLKNPYKTIKLDYIKEQP